MKQKPCKHNGKLPIEMIPPALGFGGGIKVIGHWCESCGAWKFSSDTRWRKTKGPKNEITKIRKQNNG